MVIVYRLVLRVVKKVAPYTELVVIITSRDGEQREWKHKEYISPHCAELMKQGYSLDL